MLLDGEDRKPIRPPKLPPEGRGPASATSRRRPATKSASTTSREACRPRRGRDDGVRVAQVDPSLCRAGVGHISSVPSRGAPAVTPGRVRRCFGQLLEVLAHRWQRVDQALEVVAGQEQDCRLATARTVAVVGWFGQQRHLAEDVAGAQPAPAALARRRYRPRTTSTSPESTTNRPWPASPSRITTVPGSHVVALEAPDEVHLLLVVNGVNSGDVGSRFLISRSRANRSRRSVSAGISAVSAAHGSRARSRGCRPRPPPAPRRCAAAG